jgi:hypothetical protein
MKTRLRVLVSAIVVVFLANMSAKAVCTFTNLQVTRQSSARTVTGSPTISECDTLPSSVTLDAFNFSSVFNSIQVTYRSGPANITANNSTVRPGGVVVQASIHGTKVLNFNTVGDYTFIGTGVSGPATNSVTIVVRISQFKVAPDRLNIATGGVATGANLFNVSTGLSGQIRFSKSFVSNNGGTTASSLNISNQSNSKQGIVTASPQGSSGVFRVEITTSIFKANLAYVTVPPQSLIQALIGEAQGQSDVALRSVGVVIRNRVGNPLFRQDTYQAVVLAPNQFASTTTPRFAQAANRSTAQNPTAYDTATKVAAEVFDRREGASLGGAVAFGSPGALPASQRDLELRKLQDALNRQPCSKVPAKTLGFDRRWYPVLGFDDQAIIVNQISAQTFVFVRPRPSNGCAVVSMSFQ